MCMIYVFLLKLYAKIYEYISLVFLTTECRTLPLYCSQQDYSIYLMVVFSHLLFGFTVDLQINLDLLGAVLLLET